MDTPPDQIYAVVPRKLRVTGTVMLKGLNQRISLRMLIGYGLILAFFPIALMIGISLSTTLYLMCVMIPIPVLLDMQWQSRPIWIAVAIRWRFATRARRGRLQPRQIQLSDETPVSVPRRQARWHQEK